VAIELEQDCKWQRIEKPDYSEDIVSGGMGPCVSILVYDTESKVTYGCHYSHPDTHHSDYVNEMLDNATKEFQDSEKICVFVSGAILSEKDSKQKREYIEQLLTSRFSNNAELHFK
jgi:hypothetical protein